MADLTKWKLVPVEPTEEMVRAAFGARESVLADENTRSTWAAMLSTSPAPSLPTREEIAEFLKDRDEALFTGDDFEATDEERLDSADCILALFAQPQEKKTTPVEPPLSP